MKQEAQCSSHCSGNISYCLLPITLQPSSPLFWTPACQQQGLAIIFLFVENGCGIKVRLIAKMHIIGTVSALQPLRQLLLRTFPTKIAKDRPFLFITMLILKDRRLLLASHAGAIPQVPVSGISTQAPDNDSAWYPSHRSFLPRRHASIPFCSIVYAR
jgi:hypothetical protein